MIRYLKITFLYLFLGQFGVAGGMYLQVNYDVLDLLQKALEGGE